MRATSIALLATLVCAGAAEPEVRFSGEKKRNNFVSDLLEVASNSKTGGPVTFVQTRDGWIFISANGSGPGRARVFLDRVTRSEPVLVCEGKAAQPVEAMRFARKGPHTIQVEATDGAKLEHLSVRAIPELIHCGLGFNPAIKGYGVYDLNFLKADILPNVTTLVVPSNFAPPDGFAEDWHRQGRTFIAEVGINGQGKTVEDHLQHWGRFYDQAPFLDGILINEFIVNNPAAGPGMTLSPERQQRMEQERQRYVIRRSADETPRRPALPKQVGLR